MSFGALSGLVRAWPDTVFWSAPRVSEVLPVFFPGVPVIPSDAEPCEGFSRLLLLTDSFSSAFAGWKAGIRERIGHTGQFRRAFLTRPLEAMPGRNHHHSLDYDRLASFAGAGPSSPPAPSAEPEGSAHIAVFAGAAYGAAKVWPGFAGLVRSLRGLYGLEVVLYGSGAEEASLRELSRASGGARVEADLELDALCRRLRSAILAVGNDSGGVHLAAAIGTPTVALFGSTSPVWTSPRGRAVRVLAGSAQCSPCFRRSCRKGEMVCFRPIVERDVLEAARGLTGGDVRG
jgi:ADP-heptose:LPS heptosyltransferase